MGKALMAVSENILKNLRLPARADARMVNSTSSHVKYYRAVFFIASGRRRIMNARLSVLILIGMCLILAGCNEVVPMPDDGKREWQSLGFEDKLAIRLRLFKPYLYVCAGSNGLWRKDTQTELSVWEYLGISDTSLGDYLNRGVTDVIVNTENPDIMLVAFQPDKGSDHGIFKTEDGGDTWFVSDSGLGFHFPPPWNDETYFIHPTIFLRTHYDLFAAGGSLAHTDNFGELWEVIRQNDGAVGSSYVHDFRHHIRDTNVLWLGGVSYYETSDLYFSMDGGATWDQIIDLHKFAVDLGVYSIAFDANDLSTAYLGLFDEIVKTTDGGASWIVVLSGCDAFVNCIVEDDTRPGHLFATVGNTTIKTEDGGETWVDLESPNDGVVQSMVYDSEDNALYIGTGYGSIASVVFVYK